MYQLSGSTQAALDYNFTIIGALELSEKKWVLAVQLPGVSRHSRHVLEACGDGLASFVERLKARCAAAGRKIAQVILTHEAGRDGFWLARFLARRGIEVHVIRPSSLPVDRRARRAKTDIEFKPVARFGPDIVLPDLLMELAQCERSIRLEMQFKLMWAHRLETAAAHHSWEPSANLPPSVTLAPGFAAALGERVFIPLRPALPPERKRHDD